MSRNNQRNAPSWGIKGAKDGPFGNDCPKEPPGTDAAAGGSTKGPDEDDEDETDQ